MGLKPTTQYLAWDQKSSVNLVFLSPKPETDSVAQPSSFGSETDQYLVNYSPKDAKISVLEISPQTYYELPKGYGWWKIGSVYKLGQDENPPRGGELLEQSVSQLIGLPIDGLIILKQPVKMEEFLTKMHGNRLEILNQLFSIRSDLSPLEAAKLFWKLSEVRPDKIITLNFLQSNVTDSKLLPDSSRVLGVNTVKLDLFVRDNLSDPNLEQEGKSIAIFNATSHPGLTSQVARMLTNMGADIIFTTTAQTQLEKSQIVFEKSEESQTTNRLSQIFAPDCLKVTCRSVDPKVTTSRAQINVVLGEDWWKEWNVR